MNEYRETDEMTTEQEQAEGFVIDNDKKAEWALKEIKAAQAEHDRLERLIADSMAELDEKRKENDKQLERNTSFLKWALAEYMESVTCKETKTQKTYQLLTGKLVKKNPTLDYVRDDDTLLAWCNDNMPDAIKIKTSVDWQNLKPLLTVTDGGTVCTAAGEIVEGVSVEERPAKFDIKFS